MYPVRVLKKLFLLTLPLLILVRMASAEFNTTFADDQTSLTTSAMPESRVDVCPCNQICTGDIVLITMDTDFSSWKDVTLLQTSFKVMKNVYDPAKGYLPVRRGTPSFHGFYYRVKPNKTYRFEAIYTYRNAGEQEKRYFHRDLYYKSRGDALNPGGSGAEGPISPAETKAMGLPPIPKCYRKHPGLFCTNQVVHIFWNNHRGEDKSVLDINLYINGQFIKHDNGPEYRGHFQDFYYTLPLLKYYGKPVAFQVTWTVRDYRPPYTSHYENSQILISQYTPGLAYACKATDSWQKCQNHLFDGS